jgi:hypothetical protein
VEWEDEFSTETASSSPTLSWSLLRANGGYSQTNGVLNMQTFSGPTVYNSEEEADVHGIAYGQRIIDEKVPGLKAG